MVVDTEPPLDEGIHKGVCAHIFPQSTKELADWMSAAWTP